MKIKNIFFCLLAFTAFAGCDMSAQPIHYGKDQCEFCKMMIVDNHFGAEILTVKGKTLKFDSGECMVHFRNQNRINAADVKQYLVTDYNHPFKMLDATLCFFLQSTQLPSPMGANLSAYASEMEAYVQKQTHEGIVMNWQQLIDNLK